MRGINRVVIVVKDIEKAGKLFSELLGAKFYDGGVVEKFGVRALVSWDGGLEIISPVTEDSDAARFLREKGEGVYTVIFNVDDADQAASRAKVLGVRQTGIIEFDQHPLFKKFKEILLAPEDTCGAFVALAQIERK
jgi:4-hydroxyphenylpyruvate dioxygenase-like putative hemolysin